jgi:hypothetical protein
MPDATSMSSEHSVRGSRERGFYVGYLPVPRDVKRFLRIAVPVVLWLMAITAFVISRSQRGAGAGVWEVATPRTFTGTLIATPYLVLMEDGAAGEGGRAVLIVEMGKNGPRESLKEYVNRRVTLSGWELHRDDRVMVELEPGEAGVAAGAAGNAGAGGAEGAAAAQVRWKPIGVVTLRGEIVDSKCYLGAMKPGEGKTHKECATLCIRGGIPPSLVVRRGDRTTESVLVVNEAGGPMDAAAYSFIGDQVRITGELEEFGSVRRLKVDVKNIARR